ncbi:hypothetical protein CEXT_794921 [Caerostris extrusa]|uniref:Uncharacterized protein n=1 Tax=Caerostris extrusa TaxID=172846 RepID=A0AAV4Q2Q5_CAEEX|nr:hypothetical protein CEXT_794921 [Caerostris extrusa]
MEHPKKLHQQPECSKKVNSPIYAKIICEKSFHSNSSRENTQLLLRSRDTLAPRPHWTTHHPAKDQYQELGHHTVKKKKLYEQLEQCGSRAVKKHLAMSRPGDRDQSA